MPAINCRKNDILGLDAANYHQWADRVEAGFVSAARFLRRQFVFRQYDVPYTTQLGRWPSSTRNSAAYKGLYALQMKAGAADWRTANPLSFAVWDDSHIDIHHIFPVAWCNRARPPVPSRLYNSIINKTPIDAGTNRRIGGNAPSRYLPRLQNDISPDTLDRALRAHWLNPELLAADKFAECFVERGAAMLDLIGAAMGKRLPDGREAFWRALNSAGYVEEEFDEPDDEYDVVGELAYSEDASAAD